MLLIELFILILLVFLSAYFSSMETAFVSISSLKLKQLLEEKVKNADILEKLKQKRQKLLITILICNNLVNIAASSFATLITIKTLGNIYVSITTGILTLIILIFGEITPKTKASIKHTEMALKNAKILNFLVTLLTPLVIILEEASSFILKFHKISYKKHKEEEITEETLKTIIKISEKEGSINATEKNMIHKIFEFDDTITKNIMTPRTDIFAIDLNDDTHENINRIIQSGFSRIPVYNKKIDKIVGILYAKDLLNVLKKNGQATKFDIKQILRKPYFIPENKKIDSLFNQFKLKKTHIALVVDEYGGISGLITIEDLVEEIVGDIYDETDEIENNIKKINKKEFLVNGKSTVYDLNEELNLELNEDEDYETISGFILNKLGRIPQIHEEIPFKKITLRIEKVKDHRIELIRIKK